MARSRTKVKRKGVARTAKTAGRKKRPVRRKRPARKKSVARKSVRRRKTRTSAVDRKYKAARRRLIRQFYGDG